MNVLDFYAQWQKDLEEAFYAPTQDSECYLGVMTGTSLDAIDVVRADFTVQQTHKKQKKLVFNNVHIFSKPMETALLKDLLLLQTGKTFSLKYIAELELRFTDALLVAIESALKQWELPPQKVAGCGIHGQTVLHVPAEPEIDISRPVKKLTWQFLNTPYIAEHLGIPIVADFRRGDIALNGEGAPLVPFFDAIFLGEATHARCLHNLGGISNLTFMNPYTQEAKTNVMAFDTGPANMWLNTLSQHYFKTPYDAGGNFAKQGTLNSDLFNDLVQHPFFSSLPPKSCGRDDFNSFKLFQIIEKHPKLSPFDALNTATQATAWTIAKAYQYFVLPAISVKNPDGVEQRTLELIFSGGGRENEFLMDSVRQKLQENIKNNSQEKHIYMTESNIEEFGIPSQAKEGLAFAFLAWCKMHKIHNTLNTCTGAIRSCVSGIQY